MCFFISFCFFSHMVRACARLMSNVVVSVATNEKSRRNVFSEENLRCCAIAGMCTSCYKRLRVIRISEKEVQKWFVSIKQDQCLDQVLAKCFKRRAFSDDTQECHLKFFSSCFLLSVSTETNTQILIASISPIAT